MDKQDVKLLAVLVGGFALLFAATALLDVAWVQAHAARQIVVYALMAVIAFAVFKLVRELTKTR